MQTIPPLPAPVPGACQVVQVRAWDLTDAHVIRLGARQGTYRTPSGQPAGRRQADVHGVWREVLGAYRDQAGLEGEFGCWHPDCAWPGCSARLNGDRWHVPPAAPAAPEHEHKPGIRPGQLEPGMAALAREVWDDRAGSILIRVLIQEDSDAGQIEDRWVILDCHDLIDAQSRPAAGREGAWDTRGGFPAALFRLLASAAGDLWLSTRGEDRFGALDTAQRGALDWAAARRSCPPAAGQEAPPPGKRTVNAWRSCGHDDEPRDQERYLDIAGHWAEVGPDSRQRPDGWSWTVLEFDGTDNRTVAGDLADSEDAAKQAVARWEAAHQAPAAAVPPA